MFGNTISMMEKSMDYLWKKQEVTANNIANVDTPGYRRKRVNFEETFRRKLEATALTGKNEDVRQAIQRRAHNESRWERRQCRCGIYGTYKNSTAVSVFDTVVERRYRQIPVSDQRTVGEVSMDELFIQPIQVKTMESGIESISANGGQVSGKGGAETFKSVFREAIDNVTSTENDLVNKQYLLATGQLEDAHSVMVASSQAQLAVDMLVSLRNKAMESYNELMRISL